MASDPRREQQHDEHDPHEAPTPKASGSYGRWSFFESECRHLVKRLRLEATERSKVLTKIDLRGARTCTELAGAAEQLAGSFAAWPTNDPGQDERHAQIARLFELRARTEELAPLMAPTATG